MAEKLKKEIQTKDSMEILRLSGFTVDLDVREPDPSGRLEGEARAKLRKNQWKDIYRHFMRATPSELEKIKTKQDAISFLVKKGEYANDLAVIEAAKRFAEGYAKDGEPSPKEELIKYAEKTKDPEYIKHVKGMHNTKNINARLNWHRQNEDSLEPQINQLRQKIKNLYDKAGDALNEKNKEKYNIIMSQIKVEEKNLNGLIRASNNDSCGEKVFTKGEKEMAKDGISGNKKNDEAYVQILYKDYFEALTRGAPQDVVRQYKKRYEDYAQKMREHYGVTKKTGDTKMAKDADLSAISKHWNKATIEHILKNAHLFKPEVVEEAKRLSKIVKDGCSAKDSYKFSGNIPIEKIPANYRPEFPKAGYLVYYAPNKVKWFESEVEAKRFAESQKTMNSKDDDATKSGAIKGYGEKEGSFEDACSNKDADPKVAEAEAMIKLCGGVM